MRKSGYWISSVLAIVSFLAFYPSSGRRETEESDMTNA